MHLLGECVRAQASVAWWARCRGLVAFGGRGDLSKGVYDIRKITLATLLKMYTHFRLGGGQVDVSVLGFYRADLYRKLESGPRGRSRSYNVLLMKS